MHLPGMSSMELAVLGAVGAALAVAGSFRRSSIVALVIQNWSATTQPTDPEGTYVQIQGRFPGLWSWLKATLGMGGAAGELRVDGRNVVFVDGTGTHVVPITSVSSLHHGYYRPLIPAIMIGLLTAALVTGLSLEDSHGRGDHLSMLLTGAVLGGIVGFVFYLFNKTMMLSMTEMGGAQWGFAFKGKKLDEQGAAQVLGIVQHLVNVRRYG